MGVLGTKEAWTTDTQPLHTVASPLSVSPHKLVRGGQGLWVSRGLWQSVSVYGLCQAWCAVAFWEFWQIPRMFSGSVCEQHVTAHYQSESLCPDSTKPRALRGGTIWLQMTYWKNREGSNPILVSVVMYRITFLIRCLWQWTWSIQEYLWSCYIYVD